MDHLNDDERLALANAVASARLEGQEVSMATRALMVEFLSGRLDAEAAQRLVLEEALGSLQRFRPSAGNTPAGGIMKAMGSAAKEYPGPIPGGGYPLRTAVVAADLDDLRGPVHGQVRFLCTLTLRLASSMTSTPRTRAS